MRWGRRKRRDAVGRRTCGSSLLGDPGAKFFCEKRRIRQKGKKRQKERNEGLWKLTPLWKSAHPADSHSGLKRASPTALGFFTVSTGSAAGITSNLVSGRDPP
jgi:hypothetical protein